MAINVTIARGYAWRMIIIGAACVVLGAWGVYDYAVDIPRRQKLLERQELLELCRGALETEQAVASLTPEAQRAMEAIMAEVEQIMRRELGETLDNQQAHITLTILQYWPVECCILRGRTPATPTTVGSPVA